MNNQITQQIATELKVNIQQVNATIALIDDGASIPFIARYRKEITGSLDDTQLRHLEERLRYLRELNERRETILKSIEEQEKLTPELKQKILQADSKTRLEDLYLPYKPKRRTKGQIAIEAGLEPLADALYQDPTLNPQEQAEQYLNAEHDINDAKAALDGARFILMERFAEDAELIAKVRELMLNKGMVCASVAPDKEQQASKYKDYFDYKEAYKNVPSHRALAILRGRNEGFLYIKLQLDTEDEISPIEQIIAAHHQISHQNRAADDWLKQVVQWTNKIKILPSIELEFISNLRERADEEAIKVFASNLKDLLLAAPAGAKTTMGIDPGLRTGCKVAVIDATGKVLDYTTIYPHAPQNQWDKSIATLAALALKHQVELVSIGNGTASRESDKLVAELIKKYSDLKLTKIIVSEAGASVYSASEFAAKEFPDLDVTIRGAVSIARRLQDPLAELVKIEPKAIGVGQYQHDVNQYKLIRSLDSAVEDCVNEVGVDINTASAALLKRVSGLNETIANNIVDFRDKNGRFNDRESIKQVTRFGEKTFEQAAGFLKIRNGSNPLDMSSVHPESYPVVSAILQNTQNDISQLIGNTSLLSTIKAKDYVNDSVGLPTIEDILSELKKPGRDPRPEFKMAKLQDGIEKISDLTVGMILEGTVSNVANFGAFVDLGVHQDGLVHISALSNKFIDDPRKVVKAGDIVKVKVMEIDLQRKRIGLSMRLDDIPGEERASNTNKKPLFNKQKPQRSNDKKQANNLMASKLAAAFKK